MRAPLQKGQRIGGRPSGYQSGRFLIAVVIWSVAMAGAAGRTFGQNCGNNNIDVADGEVCDPPCKPSTACAAAEVCAPDCKSCVADDDNVRNYACHCYDRLGISPADVKAALGGDTVHCKTGATQLYTTEKCPKHNDFSTTGQADCKVRDIQIGGANNPDAAANFPASCDRPAWLTDGGNLCYGNTYIHKWEITATKPRAGQSNVTIALLCRHKKVWSDDNANFDDIAMIMHNSDNGQTCWFQQPYSPDPNTRDRNPANHYEGLQSRNDGASVPLPHGADGPVQPAAWNPKTYPTPIPLPPPMLGPATRGWLKPSEAVQVNCIQCHDNGPWMNSRWLFNSGLKLRDGFQPYINKGFGFKDWKEPKFVTVDNFELKKEAGHAYENKSCTACHKIHSGEAPGGVSLSSWINYTVGRTSPNKSNATGQDFKIAYWMPTREYCTDTACNHSPHDVYAADAGDWDNHYKKHVDNLLICAKSKGVSSAKGDMCAEMKPRLGGCCVEATGICTNDITQFNCEDTGDKYLGDGVKCSPTNCPAPSASGVVASAAVAPIPGVHLYADIDNDEVWDYDILAVSPLEPGYDPGPSIPINPGTPLTIGWSADAYHLNCFIATTFPAGVEVTNDLEITTGNGTNWLLGESPQAIGELTVPGDYHFHIDCNDDDYEQITAPLTFHIEGQSPTVLHVYGIVDGVGAMAFDYPSPNSPQVDIPVEPQSEVYLGWSASNVQAGSCLVREMFAPFGTYTPGPCPNPSGSTISTDESGFEAVPLEPLMDQNYRLECLGDDGPWHCVDLTLRINEAAPAIAWDTSLTSNQRTTRSLIFSVGPPVTATAASGQSAIKVTMSDLEHPVPGYQPSAIPLPKDFTTFDTTSNGTCSNGAHAGHHCDTDADCQLCGGVGANTNKPCASDTDCPGGFCPTSVCTGNARRPCSTASHCTGFGSCGAPIVYDCGGLAECTAAGEANGCARWVGKPQRFRESQEIPFTPVDYLGARLQCTPYYHDWGTATASEPVAVFGAEILPNSKYSVQAYAPSCKGNEDSCTNFSPPVDMRTRRSGDVVSPYNPPVNTQQPDVSDIGQFVAKFKKILGSPSNTRVVIQPNLPDPNGDVSVSDIVQVVDMAKQFVYPFGGPCPCPSLATCGALACPSGAGTCIASGFPGLGPEATCVKLCRGGTNAGEQCNNHRHCGGGGICDKECTAGTNLGMGCSSNIDCPGAGNACQLVTNNAFCRDRCGRCTP